MRKLFISWHNLFFSLSGKNNYKKRFPVLWVICGINWKIATFLFNLYMDSYAFFGRLPKKRELPNNNIVVSLTSFPARINKVWMVIDSMLHQDVLPSKICLYLSEEEFPDGLNSLPSRLLRYQDYGLEINFRKENLMGHIKYYYALQEYGTSNVITIDDDIYYNRDTISNLVSILKLNPQCICSNTIHVIRFDENGKSLPYDDWEMRVPNQKPSHKNVALGYNGVLYPSFPFKKDMFDKELIKTSSLKADDLWLKAMEIKSGIKVATGRYFCRGVEIGGSQKISLGKVNINQNQNDTQWSKLCELYNINEQTINEIE